MAMALGVVEAGLSGSEDEAEAVALVAVLHGIVVPYDIEHVEESWENWRRPRTGCTSDGAPIGCHSVADGTSR